MADVIQFPSWNELFSRNAPEATTATEGKASVDLEGDGPPDGTTAWRCAGCDSFAFYITPKSFHCYVCHNPQSFG